MDRYLEDRELNSVLEEYFNEVKDDITLNESLFDDKNIYKINEKIKKIVNKKEYEFYYITIIDQKTKYEVGGYGSYTYSGVAKTVENSTIRLYGSHKKLTKDNFTNGGVVEYRYKKSKVAKRLFQKTTNSTIIKDSDLDSAIRKYLIMHKVLKG